MKVKITIITVVYNNKNLIEETIKSVISQNYENIEYIIIDGGSTDGTLDIINRYIDFISILISENDNGIYDAMNKGYEIASGEIVGILNSDDIFYSEDSLRIIASTFETFPDVDIVYGDLMYVKRDDISNEVRHWISGEYYYNYFRNGNTPAHPAVYVRNRIIRENKYNISYKFAADYDWLLRIFSNYKSKYLRKYLVRMRLGGLTNKSFFNVIKGNLEIVKSWKENHGKYSLFTILYRRPTNKFKQFVVKKYSTKK